MRKGPVGVDQMGDSLLAAIEPRLEGKRKTCPRNLWISLWEKLSAEGGFLRHFMGIQGLPNFWAQ
jgi:hypothetical protein